MSNKEQSAASPVMPQYRAVGTERILIAQTATGVLKVLLYDVDRERVLAAVKREAALLKRMLRGTYYTQDGTKYRIETVEADGLKILMTVMRLERQE